MREAIHFQLADLTRLQRLPVGTALHLEGEIRDEGTKAADEKHAPKLRFPFTRSGPLEVAMGFPTSEPLPRGDRVATVSEATVRELEQRHADASAEIDRLRGVADATHDMIEAFEHETQQLRPVHKAATDLLALLPTATLKPERQALLDALHALAVATFGPDDPRTASFTAYVAAARAEEATAAGPEAIAAGERALDAAGIKTPDAGTTPPAAK